MAEYIERDAFLEDKKWLYCTDCDKRKGKKRRKMVTLYEIGEAPCKSCGIYDMLEEVEVYPAADVRPVVRERWVDEPIKGIRYHCSVCQGRFDYTWHYCPNCGARMDDG